MQQTRSQLPSSDRIGILIASVLLTFALSHFVQSPGLTLSLSLPGFYYAFPITIGSFMTLFAAALTAAGMDWIIRDHPALAEKRSHLEHLLLPTLTAFVIGTPLSLLADSPAWNWGFLLAAVLLAAVCIAEYISLDPSAPVSGFARAGLKAVAYALFLTLVISLRFAGARMILVTPYIFVVAGLISLRILHLDGEDHWDFPGDRHWFGLCAGGGGVALLDAFTRAIWAGNYGADLRAYPVFSKPCRRCPNKACCCGSCHCDRGSVGRRHLLIRCGLFPLHKNN